jgi:flagellar operon protein
MTGRINGISSQPAPVAPGVARQGAAPSFGQALQTAMRHDGDVRISTHARERLRERNITLGEADMQRIGAAAEMVAAKGGRDALVVMDKVGLILDVANRTVVTAIERQRMQDNVFTNIDSAVFA